MLSRMVLNPKDNAEHFTYVFTDYTQTEAETIHSDILNLQQTNTFKENTDEGYKILINDMEEQTKSLNNLIVIDLEHGDPDATLRNIIENKRFRDPAKFFKLSLSLKSQNAVTNQMGKHAASIKASLHRADYDLALYKLNELVALKKLLHRMESIRNLFDVIRKDLSVFVNETFEFWPSGQRLTEIDLRKLCDILTKAKATQQLRQVLLESEEKKEENNLIEQIKNGFIGYLDNMEMKGVLGLVEINLTNLKLMCAFFGSSEDGKCWPFIEQSVREKYEKACAELDEKLANLKGNCRSMIESNNIESLGQELAKLKFFYESHCVHLNRAMVQEAEASPYEALVNELKKKIEEKFGQILEVLKRENIDEDGFNDLNSNEKYVTRFRI
jgi:hypothetical protein